MTKNSAKIDAWMPLWIGDYLADTQRLSTEQHGAYLLLLMDYWRCGALPADDDVLARIVGLKASVWAKARRAILPFFEERDGYLVHHRVEAERAKALANQERRTEKAQAAAQARWSRQDNAPGNAPGNASSNARGYAPECPSPSPSFPSEKPADAAAAIFGGGVALLVRAGETEKQARSFLGKCRKDHGNDKLLAALADAERLKPLDPKPWLVAHLKQAPQAINSNALMAGLARSQALAAQEKVA
ncbi:YdaU family protein [Sphingomonas sp. KRR8]|uniref:YdaU family protein n=1 Tax=Sphingomonas sp. KRR8 TaxID=2942996 RepID=UPI0020222EEE|nr:YdaU family protein [Sphingomonas sp. KRR8]URD60471.1 YdaU family protein [Sphingomonas sp. KRR8]